MRNWKTAVLFTGLGMVLGATGLGIARAAGPEGFLGRGARWIRAMHELAEASGERWGALATAELIRRHEQELAWLAGLGELAREEP